MTADPVNREALVDALRMLKGLMPAGSPTAPNNHVIPFYLNMGELRMLQAAVSAVLRPSAHGEAG